MWLLAPLLASACNLAPRYEAPKTAAPAAFKEAAAPSPDPAVVWKPAQPQDTRIRSNWWEIYDDAKLNELEAQAESSNQTVIGAEANFRAARALVLAASSAYLPTLTASPSFSRFRTSPNLRTSASSAGGGASSSTGSVGSTGTVSTPSTGGAISNEFILPGDISYTVDLWGRTRNSVAVQVDSAQASAADLATARLSIAAEVAQDYFEVRALDAEQRVLDDTVGSDRQLVDLTNNLFRNGIDSEEDVAQAQTQLDTEIALATDVGVSRAQFEHALASLVGVPASGFSLAPGEFPAVPPSVPLGLPSDLLQRRPDVAAAERRVAAANAQIGVARTAYFPTLTLGAAGGFESSMASNWFTWPSRFWSIGPQLAGTLFDGGARRAQTDQARAQYDASVAAYRQTVLGAFQSVEDQLAALRILSVEASQQKTAVNSAQHYFDLALTRYKAGIDSALNVTTAQATTLTTRQSQVQIQLREMTASVALVMALGGGWDQSELPSGK